jgi:hypothetical protein
MQLQPDEDWHRTVALMALLMTAISACADMKMLLGLG